MRIEHPAIHQIPQLRKLWQEAFGDTDAFLDNFFTHAFSPRRCLCVTQGDAVAAVCYWLDCEISGRKAAYVYAVATAKCHRGRGLCRALMDALHSRLLALGYVGSVLVPGEEPLRHMYGAMGYADFGGMEEFSCAAGEQAVAIQQIDGKTYAALRRQHLGPRAVVQEGETLIFLSHWAEFYEGDGFLMAANRDGDALRGLELLGDPAAAPGILKALGIARGTFRTAGAAPFAMYRPLQEAEPPTYFAFALD